MAKAPVKEEVKNVPAVQEAAGVPALIGDQVPDWMKEYSGPLGTENIDAEDVNIPRLKLGQSMTPEVKDKIVNDGDMFHSITKEVIVPVGQADIFVPIAYHKEYVLWRDRSEGGGIFARANRAISENGDVRYIWDKPNSVFTTKIKGAVKVEWKTKQFIDEDGLGDFGSMIPGDKDSQPAATAHFNYIMYHVATGSLVAVSFNRSSAKKAKDMNAMLKMGNIPMFMRCFKIGAVPDQNDAGDKFYNYAVVPAGLVQDQQLFNQLKSLYNDLKAKGVSVDWSDEEGGKVAREDGKERF